MNPYIEQLKTYLAENEPNYRGGGAKTIWEMLYWHYSEANPIENDKIRGKLAQLNECLEKLTIRENDRVFDLVMDLCLGYDQAAFYAGLRVGGRLTEELEDNPAY